jgi:hypothetical protein
MTAIIKNNDNAIDNLFGNADEMSDFLWENLVGYNSPYILATAAAKRLPYGSYDIIPDDSIPKMAAFLEAKGFTLPEMTDGSCDPGLCSAMLAELIWDSCSKKEYATIKKELKQEGAKAYLQRTKDALADQPDFKTDYPIEWEIAKSWIESDTDDFLTHYQEHFRDYFLSLEHEKTWIHDQMIADLKMTYIADYLDLDNGEDDGLKESLDELNWTRMANYATSLLAEKLGYFEILKKGNL